MSYAPVPITKDDIAGFGDLISRLNATGDRSAELWRAVLFGAVIKMIADGHDDPQAIARCAWEAGWKGKP